MVRSGTLRCLLVGQFSGLHQDLLIPPDLPTPLVDPRTTLAAHKQEVGAAAFRPLAGVHRRAEDRDHQLARTLINIAGIPVGPDMGAGLGPHLNDVVAQHAAGEIHFVCRIRVAPPAAAERRRPPLPVVESGSEIIL